MLDRAVTPLLAAALLLAPSCMLVGYDDLRGQSMDPATVADAALPVHDAAEQVELPPPLGEDAGFAPSHTDQDSGLNGVVASADAGFDSGRVDAAPDPVPFDPAWREGLDYDSCEPRAVCDLSCPAAIPYCVTSCLVAAECNGRCAPGQACDHDCRGSDACSLTCGARSECWLSCQGSGSCDAECGNSARCDFDCAEAERCTARCREGSVCTVRCPGGNCAEVDCATGAKCLIDCGGASTCAFTCRGGVGRSCPRGYVACNQECPP